MAFLQTLGVKTLNVISLFDKKKQVEEASRNLWS